MSNSNLLDPAVHRSPLRFFLAVNRSTLPLVLANILFYCFGAASLLAATYFLGETVDVMTGAKTGVIQPKVLYLILFLVGHEYGYRLGLVCEVLVLARVRANTKQALFDHTASLSYGYFADRFAGEIAHKVSTTADAYERVLLILTNNFVAHTFVMIVATVVLGLMHPNYVAFMAIWWLFFVVGSLFLAKQLHRRASIYAAVEAKTTGAVVDVYSNIGTVKVYGKKENFHKAHQQIDAEMRAYRDLGFWDVLTFHFQGLSLVILCVGLIAVTGNLYTSGIVSVGKIVFISTLVFQLFGMIWELGKNVAEFVRFRGEIIQNLNDLVVAPSILDGSQTVVRSKTQVEITYQNVTFGYVDERPVLDNFSITIEPGQKVGIVGLSGAGKTTFANLLLRFFDPQTGMILLNGTNIQTLTQESLRSQMSYISQDSSLFHATIAENIAYGSMRASLTQIRRAARLAYADEFIQAFPEGYDSVVGERGIKLSGGQRQRIAIARALLANRPLFILDEATSALDSDSEAKIQQGLLKLMHKKTVIAIAHRLSTLSHMDRIVFLEAGRVVEDGTHTGLLKRKGNYAALWRMQAGGFLPDVPRL